ncbi:four-carbon acid sugar kinase family protein [Kribbella turkmenica]|uniref:Four-carbon acid sugar kinase family protein n=1 Tax=Kribbella turkmenica TaxID=2530375 RepID=A0A4R4X8P7_9ACTN|nr:four-carbon acid sugar kinase family protein [Kribbella turkmenica]TDD26856.1 four-carbon acid sugar kinase family protein [Kribbella turkmenica]
MVEAAFYGDDFTGSTDALLQFARCGLLGVLLVDLPPIDELHALATRYDVIGVAGIARSLPPDEQEAELRPVLTALRYLNPRVVQYKICSTADSSPELGSIGRALEVGRSVFGPATVPILAAQPDLGRYTVFSHHFAAESGTVHRLDRQPPMAYHPATPMRESDLRRHLAGQTDLRIAGLHLTDYADISGNLARSTADAVVLDALTDNDLERLGQAIVASGNGMPSFAIGSGGLSRAVALSLSSTARAADRAALRSARAAPRSPDDAGSGPAPTSADRAQALVVSGSQSPRTRQQLGHALASGWLILTVPDPTAGQQAVAALLNGTPGVVVHTGRHTEQPAPHLVGTFGEVLAGVVRKVVHNTAVRRVAIAGGDTSGRIVRALGVATLEVLPADHQLSPGTVLCRATSSDALLDELHLLLKPGQLGAPDLFETFRTLCAPSATVPDPGGGETQALDR